MGFVDGLDPDNPAAFDYASGAGTLAPTFPTAAPDAPRADNRDVGATSSKKTGELRRLRTRTYRWSDFRQVTLRSRIQVRGTACVQLGVDERSERRLLVNTLAAKWSSNAACLYERSSDEDGLVELSRHCSARSCK